MNQQQQPPTRPKVGQVWRYKNGTGTIARNYYIANLYRNGVTLDWADGDRKGSCASENYPLSAWDIAVLNGWLTLVYPTSPTEPPTTLVLKFLPRKQVT